MNNLLDDEPLVVDMGETDPTERLARGIEALDARMREMQTEMNRQFASLVDRYVPRNELDQWFRAAEREQNDSRTQIEKLRLAVDLAEDRRRISTRWALGFALTVVMAGLGLLTLVLNAQ